MASVSFYLKSPTETEKEQLINLLFFYGQPKPFKYSTGQKVFPKDWDTKKQRVKEHRSVELSVFTNLILDKYEAKVKEIYKRGLLGDGLVSDEYLREEMNITFHKSKRKRKLQLMEYLKEICDKKEEQKTKDKNGYNNLYYQLKRYEERYNVNLRYESMTLDFLHNFVHHLETSNTKYKGKYKKSTINNFVERLKAFLGLATQQGYNTTFFYQNRQFSHGKEHIVREPLSEEELEKVYRCDLSNFKPALEYIRDTYIIGACTLLRHSDYSELKPEHINGDFITRHTKKKGKTVKLPVHEWVKEILNKYGGKLPPKYSNAYMNGVLPKIGKIAGIDKPVVLSYTEGGKRIEKVVPKYELMKSHSARRSGATILKDENVPIEEISKLLTHANITTTMDYLFVDMEKVAQNVKNTAFFKKKDDT